MIMANDWSRATRYLLGWDGRSLGVNAPTFVSDLLLSTSWDCILHNRNYTTPSG